jgi:hypothetical protein
MAIITIDFEASCLPCHGRSYPIEVGIADTSGRSCAWLIRPHGDWDGWDWTEEAVILHGITYDKLLRDGQPVDEVASALGKVLKGHRIIADSSIDNYWLETLATAANIAPPAKIEHISGVLEELGSTNDEIITAQAILTRQGFKRHRAGDDAKWLSALIQLLAASGARRQGINATALRSWPADRTGSSAVFQDHLSAA